MTALSVADRAKATLLRWKNDPISFVREEFGVEPDEWQKEALSAFPKVNRLAMKACKGPGKTAVLAWLILNFMATRPNCRIACVSITSGNLAQNLWPELGKWLQRSPFLSATFQWTKTAIVHKQHSGTWWAQARGWSQQADASQQAEALAGLHEDYAMAVLDESGGIPQAVMATAEAVLLSGIETKVVQAGNPTDPTGPLHRACTTERASWHVITITGDPDDPKRSPRINLEEAKRQIELWGRDNPWVKINILGEFPEAAVNALLSVDDVEAATKRHYTFDAYSHIQRKLGVDAARSGADPWCLFPRQGCVAFRPQILRNPDTVQVANIIKQIHNEKWPLDEILFDDTGHFAHGTFDICRAAGLPVYQLFYSAPASDKRYFNLRAEGYCKLADWIKAGGAIPNDPELIAELCAQTYTYKGGAIILPDKDQVKAVIGRSPNKSDALAQTHMTPDLPRGLTQTTHVATQFDPFAEQPRAYERAAIDFDPFAEVRM